MLPLVSIIVSCYNGEKYIADTLNSLLSQTYTNLEIIVVDDGSKDNSESVIKSFADKRICYYKQENGGQCNALNAGFKKASGKYIKFYDADDILHKNVIAGQVAALQDENDNVVSFIEWRRFYNNILPVEIDLSDPHTIHKDCSPLEFIMWKENPPMVQCGLWLLPTTLLHRTGLWDERLSLINDTEFFTRIFTHAKRLKFADTGYTFYRSSSSEMTLSSDLSKKGIKSAILSIDLSAKWMLQIENSEAIRKRVSQGYMMILEWAYPKHTIYVKLIERRLKQFPKSFTESTRSGKIYNVVSRLLGWKAARRLSRIYQKKKPW